jgi:hypothetical protein
MITLIYTVKYLKGGKGGVKTSADPKEVAHWMTQNYKHDQSFRVIRIEGHPVKKRKTIRMCA